MARSRSHYSQHVGIPNPSRLDLIRDHAFALQLDWFVCNQKSHRRGEHRAERDRGYTNVEVRQGDGYQGWPERAPFDGIILTAAAPEIPETLIAQLASNGRLVAPVGVMWTQELVVIDKKPDGTIKRWPVCPVLFGPMERSRK